jgi:hypothetical protein
MGIEIPDNLPIQEEKELHAKIFDYCLNITPNSLYRYRSCTNHSIDAFKNDKFLLTKPTIFNDPYDALLFVDKNKILNQILSVSLQESDERINRLLNDSGYRENEEEKFGKSFIKKIIENALHNKKQKVDKSDFWEFQKTYQEHRIDLIIELSLKSLRQCALVGCLSENVDSILMWSHYASNHTGFVLNYDFKELYRIDIGLANVQGSHFLDKKISPILYKKERFDATYYIEFHYIDDFYRHLGLRLHYPFFDKLFYYKFFLYKSTEWGYEKEWRIIKTTNIDIDNKPDFEYIDNIKPKEIYLGKDISEVDKSILIDIAKYKKIKIFQMQIDFTEKKYKLRYEKIS